MIQNPTPLQTKLMAMPLDKRLIALQDPCIFIASCIYTRDEVNVNEPVRLAPMTPGRSGYKPYLAPIIKVWQQEPLFVCDKSRRMWASYLFLALHLHQAFTNTDRRIAIVSKKFEDACAHLENMVRMYENIPEEIYPKAARPTLKKREGLLNFEDIESLVHAIASGPDQMRQYGFSSIFLDEFCFWENQEATYGATLPTIQNGGKLTIATTHSMVDTGVEPFYRLLVDDRSSAIPAGVKPKAINEFARFMPDDSTGLNFRRNPGNQLVIADLDFTADPEKRDPEWIARNKATMPPKQWSIEMERSWETYAGKAVFEGAFHKQLHVAPQVIEANPNYPIYRGWDFGGNQSCVITQIIGRRLVVLDELPNGGTNTRSFAPTVIAYCNQQYGDNMIYFDVIDPAGMWDTQRGETNASNAAVMRDLGLRPIPGRTNDPRKRIADVFELLMRLGDDGRPDLVLNPHCDMLIKGFEGGYHYPEKPSQSRKADRPVKNLYSHIMDSLQYVCGRLKAHGAVGDEDMRYERALAMPNYRFTR